MTRHLLLAGLILLLASCKGAATTEKPVSAREALVVQKDLGRIQERNYSGVAPCEDCDGIRYQLTLFHQQFSGDGTYDLIVERLREGKPVDIRVSSGLWGTLRGTDEDPNDTVIQLNPGSDSTLDFRQSRDLKNLTLISKKGPKLLLILGK